MLIILAFILLFHITSATLLFIATIRNAWWVSGSSSSGLWYNCNYTCAEIPNTAVSEALQATMILSTILCCLGFFVFIFQLFRLKQGERFVFTAILQLLSSFCVMTAASIYTAEHLNSNTAELKTGDFGYAFVVAWVAFPMTLISGLMYLVMRKRK